MASSEYETALYQPEHKSQAVDVLEPLLGGDPESRSAYLTWKYDNNPHADRPLGVVALHGGHVVGFRGCFATRLQVGRSEEHVGALSFSDACVDPEHRRRGLSVAMGDFVMRQLAGEYPVFMNTSCGKNSYPGYVRMGFHALAPKTHLNRYGLMGFIAAARTADQNVPLSDAGIEPGTFGDLVVSHSPRPAAMAAIMARKERPDGKLNLCQDEAFFQWRFENPTRDHVFYYLLKDGDEVAYVAMGLSANCRRGYILDCADGDSSSLGELLERIVELKHFSILSIYHFSATGPLAGIVKGLGFQSGGLLPFIERKKRGLFPVLVRPANPDHTEDDWVVKGLDIRDINSWAIKGIWSDDA